MHRAALALSFALVACLPARAEEADGDGPGCIADWCDDAPASPGVDRNVNGQPLATCSTEPLTGFYRDGACRTGPDDRGVHVVCAEVTEAFLSYTASRGNDLSTPSPRSRFPGLEPGDRWCLCASRWEEARRAGVAPGVVLEATEESALRIVDRAALEAHANALPPEPQRR